MPFTPLHPSVPWLAYARRPVMFSFWALTLGSMSPDVEVLPLWAASGNLYVARGAFHSLLGAVTVDALITVLAVRFLVPPFVRWVDRRWPGTDALTFAGRDLRRDPRSLRILYVSAAFGAVTHVLVDIPTHAVNPLLWPVVDTFNVVPFADQLWYDLLTTGVWFLFFAFVLRAYWRR